MTNAHSSINTKSSHSARYCRYHTYSDALKSSFSPRTIPKAQLNVFWSFISKFANPDIMFRSERASIYKKKGNASSTQDIWGKLFDTGGRTFFKDLGQRSGSKWVRSSMWHSTSPKCIYTSNFGFLPETKYWYALCSTYLERKLEVNVTVTRKRRWHISGQLCIYIPNLGVLCHII